MAVLDNIIGMKHHINQKFLDLVYVALSKWKTTAAIFPLDYTLLQVAKLGKTPLIEHLGLSIKPSLIDATLHTLSDAFLLELKAYSHCTLNAHSIRFNAH